MSSKITSSPRADHQKKMFSLIKRFDSGNQNQSGFWQAHGLSRSTFHYWLRKYRKAHSGVKPGPTGFINLKVESAPNSKKAKSHSSSSWLELSYPDGSRLSFESSVSPEYIRQLIPGFACS